jgi:hypothetical protein
MAAGLVGANGVSRLQTGLLPVLPLDPAIVARLGGVKT